MKMPLIKLTFIMNFIDVKMTWIFFGGVFLNMNCNGNGREVEFIFLFLIKHLEIGNVFEVVTNYFLMEEILLPFGFEI